MKAEFGDTEDDPLDEEMGASIGLSKTMNGWNNDDNQERVWSSSSSSRVSRGVTDIIGG